MTQQKVGVNISSDLYSASYSQVISNFLFVVQLLQCTTLKLKSKKLRAATATYMKCKIDLFLTRTSF